MATTYKPEPSALWLASGGIAGMLFGYFILPWGDGEPFIAMRGDTFGERWPDADFNRQLQEMFGIWGFALLTALSVGALVATRTTENQSVLTVFSLLLLGGAAWHQGMIGTVFGLNLFSHLPQVGAVASAIALWIHKTDIRTRKTRIVNLTSQKAETTLEF